METEQRIIDFHVHIFPEKVAERAVKATGSYYGIEMQRKGTVADLLEDGAKIGCARYLVHSTATRPDQVASVNDFLCAAAAEHPEFIPLDVYKRQIQARFRESEAAGTLSADSVDPYSGRPSARTKPTASSGESAQVLTRNSDPIAERTTFGA